MQRNFADRRAAAHRTFHQHRLLVDEHREAPVDTPGADHEARHERRLGVSGGEPVVHLDIDGRDRLRDEPVHVTPVAVLKDLEDELGPLFDEPVAPPGLLALHIDLERNRVEQAAAAEPDIGQPGGTICHDTE